MVSKGITLKIWHGGRHELGTRIGEQVLQGRAGAGDQGPLLQAEPRPRSESLAFPRIYQDTRPGMSVADSIPKAWSSVRDS